MSIKLNLTYGNFKWIAQQISNRVEPEMIMAFSKVECKREPFDKDGFPAILYERHVFYRNVENRTNRTKWTKDFPSICYPSGYGPGGYGTYAQQRTKFSKAFQLDKQAAMEGCSWGPFQELGENWEELGFKDVGEFVDTMKDGLYGACLIFTKSIKMRNLVQAMIDRNYDLLALRYNGKGYKTFGYHTKIRDEYLAAKKSNIDWSSVKAVEPQRNLNPVWVGEHIQVVEMVADPADYIDNELMAEVQDDNQPTVVGENPSQATESTDDLSNQIPDLNFQPRQQPEVETKTVVVEQAPVNQPADNNGNFTDKFSKYVPGEMMEKAQERFMTQVKAKWYTWFSLFLGILGAAWTWFKEGGWVYFLVVLGCIAVGSLIWALAMLWYKKNEKKSVTEVEKSATEQAAQVRIKELELQIQREKQQHELTLFAGKSAADKSMNTVRFVNN